MEHIKITTETATLLVLMALLVLGVLLECQRHCSLHRASLAPGSCHLSMQPPTTSTHSSVVGLHSEKPQTISLLRGELLSTHIPRPHLGSPTGVLHIWIWGVLGASPEHVHFLVTCCWPPRAPGFPAASLGRLTSHTMCAFCSHFLLVLEVLCHLLMYQSPPLSDLYLGKRSTAQGTCAYHDWQRLQW